MSTYYNATTNETREFDDEWFAEMTAAGNPKVEGWELRPPAPPYDEHTQYEPEWIDGQWVIQDKPTYKIWANAQAFMAEFTDEETFGIANSTDSTVAALRLEISTWFSQVYSNDPRVIAGLDKLVELDIITEARKEEIITL